MDKFDGINRAKIVSEEFSREVILNDKENTQKIQRLQNPQQAANSPLKKQKISSYFKPKFKGGATLKYIFCALVLSICLLGKFTSAGHFKRASDFIKDELSKNFKSSFTVVKNG